MTWAGTVTMSAKELDRLEVLGRVAERRLTQRQAAEELGVSFEEDLGPFVRGVIDAHDATVRTDGFCGYRPLAGVGVDHDRRIQGSDRTHAREILPWIHRVFGNLKTWLRGTFHGVSGKHLQRHLDEFVYRFDRRRREGELFGLVLKRAAHGEPLPYHRLVADSAR